MKLRQTRQLRCSYRSPFRCTITDMKIVETLPTCRILLQAQIGSDECLPICREKAAGLVLIEMPSQSHWAVGKCLRSVRYHCSLQDGNNAARLFPILMTYV